MEKEREIREKKEERESFFIPNLVYGNRKKEREIMNNAVFMEAIKTANQHNAMACCGD